VTCLPAYVFISSLKKKISAENTSVGVSSVLQLGIHAALKFEDAVRGPACL